MKSLIIFNELYNRFQSDYKFPPIKYNEFTITKANTLLQADFGIIAVPSVSSNRKIIFFGFKGTENIYGISLDSAFNVVKKVDGVDVVKNIRGDLLDSVLYDLKVLLKQTEINEDATLFKTLTSLFVIEPTSTPVSWARLELYDRGAFAMICSGGFDNKDKARCSHSEPATKPYCNFIVNGNECCNYNAVKELFNFRED